VRTDFGHRLKPRFDRFNGRGLHAVIFEEAALFSIPGSSLAG
jgi:hypothetical protein